MKRNLPNTGFSR